MSSWYAFPQSIKLQPPRALYLNYFEGPKDLCIFCHLSHESAECAPLTPERLSTQFPITVLQPQWLKTRGPLVYAARNDYQEPYLYHGGHATHIASSHIS